MRRTLVSIPVVVVLVAAGCGGGNASAPEPVTVEGAEYGYVAPDEIEGGVVAMRFVNTGEELHEFALGRIDGGHTLDEALQALMENDGDVPWLHDVGGVPLLSPRQEITLTRRLEPGRYALLCFFPNPDGKPHLDLGMKRELRVVGESDASLPTPDAVIAATAEEYSVPEIEAGTRTLELRNESGEEPSWYLSVPKPGVGVGDFEAWLEGGQQGDPPITFHGAMQSFPSGESVFATLELVAGTRYRLDDDEGGLPSAQFTPR